MKAVNRDEDITDRAGGRHLRGRARKHFSEKELAGLTLSASASRIGRSSVGLT